MTPTAVEALKAIRRDPVGFCRTVLRFEPWSKQREIIESVRDNRRTAVRSAHGSGRRQLLRGRCCGSWPRIRTAV